MAVLVNDPLPVFLEEFAPLRRQEIEHALGRTAKPHPVGRDNDRPVYQDRMRADRVKQCSVRERRIAEAELMKRCIFFTENLAHGQTGAFQQLSQ